MSFGKNPANLGAVGSFRQMGQAWNEHRNEKKSSGGRSGGNVPSWVNEYKPPTDTLDLIRVIAGDYSVQDSDRNGALITLEHLPFWPFVEHYDSRSKKRSVCSGGPHANDRNKRQPCHGCDLFWSSMKKNDKTGKMERGFMGRRDMVAFTILHFHNYHKVPQVDQQGRPRVNPNTNEPYYSWLRCDKDSSGRGKCEYCTAGLPAKFGQRLHWAMGGDHYNTLIDKDAEIGESCSNCGGRDTISSQAWVCSNPDCGEAIIEDSSQLRPNEIAEAISHHVNCPTCKQTVPPVEIIGCSNCDSAKRATIFDVDLRIGRVEASDGSNRTTLKISSFSEPHPIQESLLELAKPEKLNQIYAPTPLQTQAVLFSVTDSPTTRSPVTSGTAARAYNK